MRYTKRAPFLRRTGTNKDDGLLLKAKKKMKAKKYRIGNFARINDQTIKLTPKYFKYLDMFKDVEPLILTEQWLIDFGFNIIDRYGSTEYTRKCIACYRMYGQIKIRNPHGFIADLTYVHELQNLWVALGGKELEIKKDDEQ